MRSFFLLKKCIYLRIKTMRCVRTATLPTNEDHRPVFHLGDVDHTWESRGDVTFIIPHKWYPSTAFYCKARWINEWMAWMWKWPYRHVASSSCLRRLRWLAAALHQTPQNAANLSATPRRSQTNTPERRGRSESCSTGDAPTSTSSKMCLCKSKSASISALKWHYQMLLFNQIFIFMVTFFLFDTILSL